LRLKPISGSGCVPDETGFLGVAQGSLGFLVQVPEASHPFLPQGSKRMYQLIHKRGSRLRRGGRQHDKFQGLEPRQRATLISKEEARFISKEEARYI